MTIDKRIPIAAGLGGGSADAAAILRAANRLAGDPLDADALRALGAGLGADVPSQIEPAPCARDGRGRGRRAARLAADDAALGAGRRRAWRPPTYTGGPTQLGATRANLDADGVRELAARPLGELAAALENDLEAAAVSLRPVLSERLDGMRQAGALTARVTGSGPTVFGVFRAGEAPSMDSAIRAEIA